MLLYYLIAKLISFVGETGWFVAGTPGTYYEYQRSTSEQNFMDGRTYCQQIGGDLAHLGIRDLTLRG